MTTANQIYQHALPGTDDIVRRELDNGIVVLARENFNAQSVVVHGSVPAGAIAEPPSKNGLANFLGNMLTRGTQNRDFATFHHELESVGASVHMSGAMHSTAFQAQSLSEDLPTLLDIVSDALRHPAFPEAQVDRLRGELLTYLKIRQQNTRYMSGRRFRELAYPADHPYHQGLTGTEESLRDLSIGDLRAFHEQHFGSQGMILVVVGNVKAEEAIRQVEDIFGQWENPDQVIPDIHVERPIVDTQRAEHVTIPGKSQVDITLGVIGPSRFADDYMAARLANNILGVFGMYGRLGKSVREAQGLAYYSYSQLMGGYGPGPWQVVAGVDPQNVEQAVSSIIAEIRRMLEQPVTAEDLNDNKSNLIGSLPLQLEGNHGVAGAIYNMERYDLGLDYLRGFAGLIDALTAEDVQQAMQAYWSADAYVVATAGPEIKASS